MGQSHRFVKTRDVPPDLLSHKNSNMPAAKYSRDNPTFTNVHQHVLTGPADRCPASPGDGKQGH